MRAVSGGESSAKLQPYGIVYEIHDYRLIVLVLKVGHRREIYR